MGSFSFPRCGILLSFAVACLMASGCISYTREGAASLSEPVKDPGTVEIAWMSLPRGGVYGDKVHISKVGDQLLHLGEQQGRYFIVSPGRQKVAITYIAYRLATPGFASAEVEADLKPGHRYYATGAREGEFVNMYVVDAISGEIVSEVGRCQFVWQIITFY